MKKCISVLILLATIVCLLPSCKKCYTCSTTCYTCILRDSTGGIVDNQKICSDSVRTFKSQKAAFTAGGYNCNLSKANYSIDYCINNKKGSDQYNLYYEGNGKYTCTEK